MKWHRIIFLAGLSTLWLQQPPASLAVEQWHLKLLAGDNQSGFIRGILPRPLQVRLTDANQNPVPNAYIAFLSNYKELILRSDSLNFNGRLWKEAEEGTVLPPMQRQSGLNASMNGYIELPLAEANYNQGRMDWLFQIPQAGKYRIWLRVITPSDIAKSFYLIWNENPPELWKTTVTSDWRWLSNGLDYSLVPGLLHLSLQGREPGVKIDRLLLTLDAGYEPTNLGEDLGYQMDTHLLWLEAERSLLIPPMASFPEAEAASGNFIMVPIAEGNNGLGAAGLSFYIFETRKYKLWLRHAAPDANSNSIRIQIDAREPQEWNFAEHGNWEWAEFPEVLDFNTGPHTLWILGRESGTRVDKILLADDLTYTPMAKGERPSFFGFKTDSNGVARAYAYLGQTSGLFDLYASAPSVNGSPVHFNMTVKGQQATYLHLLQGVTSAAPVATALPESVKVRVSDYLGYPRPGHNVSFRISQGDGLVNGKKEIIRSTDPLGQISAAITLGSKAGTRTNEITITSTNADNEPLIGSPVYLYPVALAAPAIKMQINAGQHQIGRSGQTLTTPLTIKVTDRYENPVSGVFIHFFRTQGQGFLDTDTLFYDQKIYKEAEEATIYAPMQIESDPEAGNGAFIVVPVAEGNYNLGRAEIPVYVPESGSFELWLRALAPNDNSNSIYTSVDGMAALEWKLVKSDAWVWQKHKTVPSYRFAAGFHTLTISGREPGSKIDKILFCRDPGFEPVGKGSRSTLFGSYSDAEGLARAWLTLGDQLGTVLVLAANDTLMGSPQLFQSEIVDTLAATVPFKAMPANLPPATLTLYPNYPNPFCPSSASGTAPRFNSTGIASHRTTIAFDLSDPARVSLSIFDLTGRRVHCFDTAALQPGRHSFDWNGNDSYGHPAASGVYLLFLEAITPSGHRHLQTRRMILLR